MLFSKQKSVEELNTFHGIVLSSIGINILNIAFPIAIIQLYDRIIPNGATESLIILSLIIIGIILFDHMLKYARASIIKWNEYCCLEKNNLQVVQTLMTTQLDKLSNLPLPKMIDNLSLFKDTHNSIEIRKKILKVDLIFVTLFAIILATISPILFLCLVIVDSIFLHTCNLLSKCKKDSYLSTRNYKDKYSLLIYNLISSMHTIKSSGIQRSVAQLEGKSFREFLYHEQREKFLNLLLHSVIKLFSQLNIITVMVISSVLIIDQKLSMGSMGACILIGSRIFTPLMQSIDLENRSLIIEDIISTNEENKKDEDIISFPNEDKIDEVCLEDIEISYENPTANLIKDFSLKAVRGDIILLDGPNGCGKTSIMKVLSGLQPPSNGMVWAKTTNYEKCSIGRCRSKISYISDYLKLFNGSILENLTFFDPSKANQAKEICVKLGSYDLINNLPNGILSQIGQGEIDVISHGTKQQISLARALLPNPDLIIIDDACLGIDEASMKKISAYLKSISQDKIIVIASTNQYFRDIANKTVYIKSNSTYSFNKEMPNVS